MLIRTVKFIKLHCNDNLFHFFFQTNQIISNLDVKCKMILSIRNRFVILCVLMATIQPATT